VSDADLRELERKFRETGAVEDEAAWFRERLRVGEVAQGTLRIKDRTFEVTEATLDGYLEQDGQLLWEVGVSTSPREFDGEVWQPGVYGGDLLRLPIATVLDLPGTEVVPEGDLFLDVFEQEAVTNSVWRFLDLAGSRLWVRWTGLCCVGWCEEYSDDLELVVETGLHFGGIKARIYDEEKAVEVLSKTLDPSQFVRTRIAGAPGFVLPES